MRTMCLGLLVLLLAWGCSDDNNDGAGDPSDGETTADGDSQSGGAGDGDGDGDGDGTSGGDGDSSGGDGDGDGAGASGGDGTTEPSSPINPTGIVDDGWEIPPELLLCGDRACACADGVDNDADGTADGFDTECTGPNDDDEGSFATGIPGDNVDPNWQDCFFDGNSGGGDDGCRYATGCITGELEQSHDDCTLSQQCIDFCAPRTPNGCDCFGCCDIVDEDGQTHSVLIASDCDEANLDACTQCVKSATDCNNECGECELCPGKTIDDLPDSCWTTPPDNPPGAGSGGTGGTGGSSGAGGTGGSSGTGGAGSDDPPYVCDGGVPSCTAHSDCASGRYCSFGCCLLIPPQ